MSLPEAALEGHPYPELPPGLPLLPRHHRLHHLHHLSARIPNYNLPRAHEENPEFQDVPTLTLADGIRCVRLKLWDEEQRRLVGWSEVRRNPA